MAAMRAAVLAALAVVLAGCGGGAATTSAKLDSGAAQLVPPNAIAFVSADSRFDSPQWRTLFDLVGPVKLTAKLKDAVGDQLNVACIPTADGSEVVAIVKPTDEAKLRSFAANLDKQQHYTVQKVGDWSVVADSQEAFDAVRSAAAGRSLADVAQFRAASGQVDGNALATAYADGTAVDKLGGRLAKLTSATGSPKWVAAQLVPEDHAARLEIRTSAPTPASAYRPTLLRDVPSGAIAAVSFKDADGALANMQALDHYLGFPVKSLLPALRGEGVAYVLPGALIPIFVFEVQSPQPDAAERALRKAAARVTLLPLRVTRYGARVVLTNAPASFKTPSGSLVDDQPYKDALAAAGVPDRVTFVAYADVQRLRPLLELLMVKTQRVEQVGSLVAFGTPSRMVVRAALK